MAAEGKLDPRMPASTSVALGFAESKMSNVVRPPTTTSLSIVSGCATGETNVFPSGSTNSTTYSEGEPSAWMGKRVNW